MVNMPAPPVSALAQLAKLNPELVVQVRDRFLQDAVHHPDLYEPSDLDQIRQNQWQVQRFLLECKLNVDQAYESLRSAMEWRREFGVHRIRQEDFPREYYQSGYIFRYGRDNNGAMVIYFRANIHRKTAEWNDRLKQFFIHQIEQIDLNSDGKGVTLLIDCTNIGVSNVDMDLLKFIVTSFSRYYPKLFDAIIIHQLPFLLQYVFKLVQTWLPEDDRKFFHMTNRKTLQEFIRDVPSFLSSSSSNNSSWNLVPENQNILPAKDFVRQYGQKFSLRPGDDEKLLNYLSTSIIA